MKDCNLSIKRTFCTFIFTLIRFIVREAVHRVMSKQNLSWKDLNAIPGEYIINKHTLRDRTEVITERNEQLKESRDNKLLISAFTNVYFVLALYIFRKTCCLLISANCKLKKFTL